MWAQPMDLKAADKQIGLGCTCCGGIGSGRVMGLAATIKPTYIMSLSTFGPIERPPNWLGKPV